MTSATDPYANPAHASRTNRVSGLAPTLLRLPDLDQRHAAPSQAVTVESRSIDGGTASNQPVSLQTGDTSITFPAPVLVQARPVSTAPMNETISMEKPSRTVASNTVADPEPNSHSILEWAGSRSMLVMLLIVIALYAVWGPRSSSPPDPTDDSQLAETNPDDPSDVIAADLPTLQDEPKSQGAPKSPISIATAPPQANKTPESLASIAPPVVGRDWFDRPPVSPGESELNQIPFEPEPPVQPVAESKVSFKPNTNETATSPSPATKDASKGADIDWRTDASKTESVKAVPTQSPVFTADTIFPITPVSKPIPPAPVTPPAEEPTKNRPKLSPTPHGVIDWSKYLPGNSPSPAPASNSAISVVPSITNANLPAAESVPTTASPIEPNFEFALPNPSEVLRSSAPVSAPNEFQTSGREPRVATPTPNPPNFR